MKQLTLLATVGTILLFLSTAWPAFNTPQATVAALPDQNLVERGRQLFAGKGCIGCHWHADLKNDQVMTFREQGPPDLTDYAGDPEFLREWLADPASVRPGTTMPTLGLSDPEINALAAFLLAEPTGSR